MNLGQPFSYQLQATGPTGPLTWTLEAGTLPDGITLSSDGVISGTPTTQFGLARLRVTEDATGDTDTRLLFLWANGGFAPISTGATLPDGERIGLMSVGVGQGTPQQLAWIGEYAANGVLAPLATTNLGNTRFSSLTTTVNPAGTQLVMRDLPTPGGPPTSQVSVTDTLTGATIQVLDPTNTTPTVGGSFSPNGAFLALFGAVGGVRIFETANWSVVRTIAIATFGSYWGPDSTEIVFPSPGPAASVSVVSATDPALDRTFAVAGQSDCRVEDWSVATNRVALSCGSGLVTASAGAASDPAPAGTDVRVVASSTCFGTLPCATRASGLRFSPSGSHLVVGEWTFTEAVMYPSSTRLVVIADVANGIVTPITDPLAAWPGPGQVAVPVSWFNTP